MFPVVAVSVEEVAVSVAVPDDVSLDVVVASVVSLVSVELEELVLELV
ncbi:hypothetical protein SSU98_0399 [Streptococcus suis 98HAH33]|nr:hypothetical protein SSU05_0413 [Streptococcus suis 05ZYH33]ABP91557.1 hypothetical protein SSU98_0399 [Streptococcus suis 98HAH33]